MEGKAGKAAGRREKTGLGKKRWAVVILSLRLCKEREFQKQPFPVFCKLQQFKRS